ncbi:MAG TPA: TlpA disulfide reductase family protein [Phycisphaerales bacterium]|nr:TlpA disulfide reductase family protein [Phycisphaerales bacterium]HMP36829.1 TlpA disulfide reductase family protein [Phycisphaerales bacterium]
MPTTSLPSRAFSIAALAAAAFASSLLLAGGSPFGGAALAVPEAIQGAPADGRSQARPDGRQSGRQSGREPGAVDPAWLERMPKEDRETLDYLIGFEPPALPGDVTWINGEGPSGGGRTWDDLRGKVVVIQTWTHRNAGGRGALQRLANELKAFSSGDVALIGLHTPEGADKAEEFIAKNPTPFPTMVDTTGVISDDLGAFRRPVNIVIDRTGNVRYAGLSSQGLARAVTALVAETPAPDAAPTKRTAPAPTTPVPFPTFSGSVTSARDLRGQSAPPFHVAEWISDRDEPRGRLLIIDFFATWCRPCMAAIPHMNAIADKYRNDVCVVAVSNESKGAFNQGLAKARMKVDDFKYAIAVDPAGRMNNAFGVRGIPHCAIVSADGVVRWQGHPGGMTDAVIDSLVLPNRAIAATSVTDPRPKRWQREIGKRS